MTAVLIGLATLVCSVLGLALAALLVLWISGRAGYRTKGRHRRPRHVERPSVPEETEAGNDAIS
jgi:hypothetical protein